MQRITLRFYAELNDFLPPAQRYQPLDFQFHVAPTVKDVIESFGVPHTEVDLVLVNGESVDFTYRPRDGDRIAVYPVFESIDISPIARVRPKPLRSVRFVCDSHLGRLAAYLRMLGFDTVWNPKLQDRELAEIAQKEHRILLTRDRGLLMRRAVSHGYYVRSTNPRHQLGEVVERFDLASSIQPFTRCLRCNALLRPASPTEVAPLIPPGVLNAYSEFCRCDGCGKVYWDGSHTERMEQLIRQVRGEQSSLGPTDDKDREGGDASSTSVQRVRRSVR